MNNSRRREERVTVKLPIRVWGMDANARPFSQSTTTLDVTRTGARLGNLQCALRQGDIIGIQHGNDKARFRVAWVGKPGTGRQGQVGVVCAEPGKYIWGLPLERLKAAAQPPGENVPLGPSFAGPPPAELEPNANPDERRDAVRYACTGGAEFRNIEGGFKNWGTVSDVSDTGCYIETVFPLPPKTQVDLLISIRNIEIRCRGLVRSSHPNVGMGVEFLQLSAEDRQRVHTLISAIAVIPSSAQRPTPAQQPATRAVCDVPTTLRPAAIEPPPPAPREKTPNPSDGIYKTCAELRDAEALLESSALAIEPRAINELMRAIDHARQTTESIQNWLENGSGQNGYKFQAERDAARVRTVTELARELCVDIDASVLNLGSEGLEALVNAISLLHKRLVVLMQKGRTQHTEQPTSPS